MGKNIPVISRLLKAMILKDYKEAMDIVTDEDFDPNEKSRTLEEPILSAIITVLCGSTYNSLDGDGKAVLKAITANKKFNPNNCDREKETVLMHIARYKEFNWLAPFILNHPSIDLSLRNYMGRTAFEIASHSENIAIRDLLLSYNIKNTFSHLPKKKVGIKKKATTNAPSVSISTQTNVLTNIEVAFTPESKENPVSLYNLVKNFVKGNYDECIKIVKSVHFNPNEVDRWEEPALSSIIYYSQDSTVEYDNEKFKEIVKEIINNRQFDVNAIDADCNTPLMVAIGFPKLDWLVKELFKFSSARIDIINDMGEDVRAIADKCGNTELLNDMIRRSYETANVVG